MTRPIDRLAPPAVDAKRSEKAPPRELETATREFEAIFVRSLLANTSIAGKGDAYGGMAVDALAKSVTAGPGLGLGELIRRAVENNSAPPLKSDG